MNGCDCWGPDTKISQIDFCHIFISYATFLKQCHLMRNDSYEHMHIWKHYAPKKEQTTVDVESEEIWKRKPFIQLSAIVSTGMFVVLSVIDALTYPCSWTYCHTRPYLSLQDRTTKWNYFPKRPPTHPAAQPGGSLHWNNYGSSCGSFLNLKVTLKRTNQN